MSSKVFLVLGLLVAAIALLISSEVAARDICEISDNDEKNAVVAGETNGVYDAKYGGYPGGGYGGYSGGGYGGYPGHGGYGGGGYCHYGCCGRGYYGRGCRCCSNAGEGVNAKTEANPHN